MDMAGLNVPVFGKLPQWTCYETAEVMVTSHYYGMLPSKTVDFDGNLLFCCDVTITFAGRV